MKFKGVNAKLIRYALIMQGFRGKIQHTPGKTHFLADMCSRDLEVLPKTEAKDYDWENDECVFQVNLEQHLQPDVLMPKYDTKDTKEAQRADPELLHIITILENPETNKEAYMLLSD